MNALACRYALVRFLPSKERGEFLNVGVALACPATGYLETRLLPAEHDGSVVRRFPRIDSRVYCEAMAYFTRELARVAQLATGADSATVERVFAELVRPRESLLRFGEVRAVMAASCPDTLRRLFRELVDDVI